MSVTHLSSILLQFIHRPVRHSEAVQLAPGVSVFVLEAVYTALDELHVVLGQRACLVCEYIFHLQGADKCWP